MREIGLKTSMVGLELMAGGQTSDRVVVKYFNNFKSQMLQGAFGSTNDSDLNGFNPSNSPDETIYVGLKDCHQPVVKTACFLWRWMGLWI